MSIGDVVEAKKVPWTPTDPRASGLTGHGLDLDLARWESRNNAEESVAGFLGLEASGSPRDEFDRPDVPTNVRGDVFGDGHCN